ncbi:hypothetical protein H0B56_21130 [Haloechinothrix sp. YIM 98757]|uniref:Uncharacterized protein n=1 Tax=Haloechinothrix aidingensis TaxID=2752311 RepID=A0A838AFE8_9PSEU|nr:hypothetical protein [Haloechinothrix aidingensis]MBA0128056.1 hypothetical protein [Haloechinothrix aidingensis]
MGIDTKIDGDPESIWNVADWVRDSLADGIEGSADKILSARNDADSGWEGPASENFRDQMTDGGRKADDFAEAAREMARKFEDIGGALKRAQDDMADIRTRAASAGLTVDGQTIQPPGSAPPDPGPAPSGNGVTQQQRRDHQDAVAAHEAHAARVEAYEKAERDAEDVRRTWQQAVDELNDTSKETSTKAWFTVADIAVKNAVSVAGQVHSSRLLNRAQFYFDDAKQAMQHLRHSTPEHVTNRAAFYEHQDYLRQRVGASSRAGSTATTKAASAERAWRGIGRMSGPAFTLGAIAYDIHQGKSWQQASASNGIGFAASVGAGAAVGTAIGGPVGTAVGTVVGAGVGVFTSGMVDSLWENGVGNVGDAIVDGGKAVAETGQAIGTGVMNAGEAAADVASDVGGAVTGGVKDAWNAVF